MHSHERCRLAFRPENCGERRGIPGIHVMRKNRFPYLFPIAKSPDHDIVTEGKKTEGKRMENVKILTVGAGAVGAYFTGRLAQAGAEVSVVVRSDYEAVRANGFEILSAAGDFHFQPHGVYRSAEEYPGKADYVFLTSKFFPETDEASMLRGAMGNPGTALVLIQNGIGIEDKLAAAFPDHEILSSIAYIGATRLKPGTVQQKGASELKFGRFGGGESAAGRRLEALFSETIGVQAAFVENIAWFRWSKLLWNLPYNPVSVLGGGVDTSRMTDRGPLEALTRALMEEVRLVAAAEGVDLPESLVERNVEFTRNFPPYKTSMLVDFEAGRRMEVEAILGNVCRLAEKHRLKVPCMQTCYALLSAVAEKR